MEIKTELNVAETAKSVVSGFQNKETAPYFYSFIMTVTFIACGSFFGFLFLNKLDSISEKIQKSNDNVNIMQNIMERNKIEVEEIKSYQKEIEITQKDHEKRIIKIESKWR